ncbi:MAG: hypothetical protein CO186_04430 [Zetaproteobacteria bacterium CG_4_9_14_3_um_filter_49_83]|nr:MAG: hypothetical protein COW62_09320 [Zetaproteobacteria bacterium CG17_big_fil_post_rev_8_21_14_2_50_50_13]PIV29281.1 MAG: hypothetical protein COS35_12910 [Zetaproteobacteria bacterium CG02_land_8_20_14_3_00_50_9]PIY54661.1 MAG: hypothetical protein COZ00_14050 [Zetaproteobacteria bacterium CG_4_10_14_0_8_um_filter_49_80]PJA35608.1 MAG: hypothetical protein CO186_04430 [Zetaproteobacteria bacterium CG_4_9_14_3_um_filter_49_83]
MNPLQPISFRLPLITLAVGWLAGWFSYVWLDDAVLLEQQVVVPESPARVETSYSHPQSQLTTELVAPVPVVKTNAKLPQVQAPVEPDAMQLFNAQLNNHRFASAMHDYWPVEAEQKAREHVMDMLASLERQDATEPASRLMQAYRSRFPDDLAAGLVQARLWHKLGQLAQEALLLMELRRMSVDASLQMQLDEQVNNVVQQYKEQLKESEQYSRLLDFARKLSNIDGANPEFQWLQAMTLVEMGQLEQARTLLEPLVYDPSVSTKAERLLHRIDQIVDAEYTMSVPLQRSGDHFLVPISVNGSAPVLLLLDTGASITLLEQSQLLSPGNTAKGNIELQTANGVMRAALLPSNRVRLGSFELENVDIALIRQPMFPTAKGLLGMNILKHFDFFIDQEIPALKLSLRATGSKQ